MLVMPVRGEIIVNFNLVLYIKREITENINSYLIFDT